MDQRVEAERKVDRIVREPGKRGAVIDHVTDVRAFGKALPARFDTGGRKVDQHQFAAFGQQKLRPTAVARFYLENRPGKQIPTEAWAHAAPCPLVGKPISGRHRC